MKNPEEEFSYEDKLFGLVHEPPEIDKLLYSFNVAVNDDLSNKNKKAFKILTEGAYIVSKYIFLQSHVYRYIRDNLHTKDDDIQESYFHIVDQFMEVELEVIHSLLLARVGMVKQAINTLRRSFEAAIYGSFLCTTFSNSCHLGSSKDNGNPFVSLMAEDLWATGGTDSQLRYSDLKPIITEVSEQNRISKTKARQDILSGFTGYYLNRLCRRVCRDHCGSNDYLVYSLTTQNKCADCDNRTPLVLVEKSVTMDLMIAIINEKLRRLSSDAFIKTNDLYTRLSSYVHPNPKHHQHTLGFDIDDLAEWKQILIDTVRVLIWTYMRSIQYIGYDEPLTAKLLNAKQYDISGITLQKLLRDICIPMTKGREKKKE